MRRPARTNGHHINGHHINGHPVIERDSWLDTTGEHYYPLGTDTTGEPLYLPPTPEPEPQPPDDTTPGRNTHHIYPPPAPLVTPPAAHPTPPPPPTHTQTAEGTGTQPWAIAGGALAAMFAADLLSWSEEDPERWNQVIADYLPGCDDPSALGWWDGTGRQRVDLALPGQITTHTAERATVEVLVRIVPYSRAGSTPIASTTTTTQLPIPARAATAPAPAAAGWRGETAQRARLLIPIARTEAGVVIDHIRLQGNRS